MTRLSANATNDTKLAVARAAPGGVGHDSPILRELVDRRTLKSKTFLHEDGKRTIIVHPKPLHYRDTSDSEWLDIDFSWEPSSRDGYAWEAVRGPYKVWIADRLRASPFVHIERRGSSWDFSLGAVSAYNVVTGGSRELAAVPNLRTALLTPKGQVLRVEAVGGINLSLVANHHRFQAQVEGASVGRDEVAQVSLVPYGLRALADDYYGSTDDGRIWGQNATYSTARTTSYGSDATSTTHELGQIQSGIWYLSAGFLRFDTSGIDDGDDIASAELYVCADADSSTEDFDVDVYELDWVDALSSGREGKYDAARTSGTLEGTLRSTSAGWSSGTYYSLEVEGSRISKTGDSGYVLVSDEWIDGNQPSNDERVYWRSANYTGTSSDPYLSVTIGVSATVEPPAATATASMPAPTITTEASFSVGNAAAATAEAPVPDVSIKKLVFPPAATATAEAPAPSIITDMIFAAGNAAAAAAEAPVPDVAGGITFGADNAAAATAEAPIPVFTGGAGVSGVTATATASASVPIIDTERLSPLKITVGGVDVTAYIPIETVSIDNVETNRITSAFFKVMDGGALGMSELDEVIISNPPGTIRWFAGYIHEMPEQSVGPFLDYDVTCVDYAWDLEHPEDLITATYTAQNDSTIISAIMAVACPDIDATTYVETVYAAIPSLEFKQATPREIIEKLAQISGAMWYIDTGPGPGVQKAYLHYFDDATYDAPYNLSDDPDETMTYSYEELVQIKTAPEANRVIVKGANDITVTRTLGLEGDYGRWLTAKLVDTDITTEAQAQVYGDNYLARAAANPTYTCTTRREGLRAGQSIDLTNAARSLAAVVLQVRRVTTTFLGAAFATYKLELGKYIPRLADLLSKDQGGGGGGGVVPEDEWEDWELDDYLKHFHDVEGNTSSESSHTHGLSGSTGSESSHTHGVGSLAAGGEATHTHGAGSLATGAGSSHTHTYDKAAIVTGVGSSHGHSITTSSANTDTANTTHAHSLGAMCCIVGDALSGEYQHSHTVTTPGTTTGAEGRGHYHAYDRSPASTGTEATHTHGMGSLSTDTGGEASHTHTVSGSTGAGSSHSHSLSGNTGAGSSHYHTANGTLVTGVRILE